MKPFIPHPYDAQDDEELFDDEFSVASMTECTGLIPAAPVAESETDSYSEIYDIPLSDDTASYPKNNGDKKKPS